MKSLVISAWVSMIYILDTLGGMMAAISGWTDWSLVGWAFGGSTVYVVYEVTQGKKRKGWHRLAMIAMGIFIAMAFNTTVAKKLDLEIVPATVGLGLLTYIGLGKLFKKAEKAESLNDLTDMKP